MTGELKSEQIDVLREETIETYVQHLTTGRTELVYQYAINK